MPIVSTLLSPAELNIVNLLNQAYDEFLALEKHSDMDDPMFLQYIVNAQCLVMSRPVERDILTNSPAQPEEDHDHP